MKLYKLHETHVNSMKYTLTKQHKTLQNNTLTHIYLMTIKITSLHRVLWLVIY
jgi:hypothetical protein